MAAPTHVLSAREAGLAEQYAPVNSVVFCCYWQYVYRVVAIDERGVTVEMLESDLNRPEYRTDSSITTKHKVGSVWSHRTPLDPRDRVLYRPAN